MSVPKILAFAGSTRKASFNRRLLPVVVDGARAAGAEVTVIDLAEYPLPLFQQDEEAEKGLPAHARTLKDLFKSHGAVLLACPEYNGSITPLLKNTLDWISRQDGAEAGGVPYRNKLAALVSASSGRWGGMRGLRHVREILTTLGVTVIPDQYNLSAADKAFDEQGRMLDDKARASAAAIGERLAKALQKWSAA